MMYITNRFTTLVVHSVMFCSHS